MNNRKKIFHRAVGILLSGSLVLTGQVAYAEEKQPCQTTYEEEAVYSSGIVDGEKGFSYRLYYADDARAAASGRRGAGVQEPLAEITAYSGTETEITIPGVIDGKEVKSIGTGAFKGNTDITRVTIAEGITSIGYEAFSGCENLTAVSIPSTVTNWNDKASNNYESKAFENCTALSELILAEGLKILGQRAFQGCTSLERVSLPSTIEECHNQVFSGCSALKSLELKEGIREIGYKAFENCTALEEVNIPSTIENWDRIRSTGVMAATHDCAPFIDCTSLKKITFQEGLKTLNGFQGSRGCPLVTELVIPASVENMDYAFTDCTYLESVTLQEGPERIGESAFQRCSALREMQVPNTVVSVGANAFNSCTALERLVFSPATVSLEGSITSGCSSLKELYLLAEAVNWYQPLGFASDGKLYCLEGSSTYGLYYANVSETVKKKLAFVPSVEAEAEGYTLTYDGNGHAGVAVKGTEEGDIIRYCVDEGKWQEEVPELKEPGTYHISVTVKRFLSGEPMKYSSLRVESQILKRQYTLHLPDVEVAEGESYDVAGEGYEGTEEPVYKYYKDAACTQLNSGKPKTAGVYYVRAEVAETEYDAAIKSNVAKITIHEIEPVPSNTPDPGTTPSANPGETDPGNQPGTTPSANPGGTDPGNQPSTTPSANPGGTDPGNQPGTTPSANPGGTDPGNQPSTSPSANPGGTDPGSQPSTSPSANPGGTNPGNQPGTPPSANPSTVPSQAPGGSVTQAPTSVAKGSIVRVKDASYKVTGGNVVEYSGTTKKNPSKVTIPAAIKVNGKTYNVTSIKANVFKGNKKLKSVVIGKNIKTIGKQAFFQCSKLKTVTFKGTAVKKINKQAFSKTAKKITVTAPKESVQKYKKLMKKAGISKKAKYKKK